ncbi:hypothetical protein Q3H58_002713 [Pseudomonas psychrotolerans]|nr:hypothetical protein [Pseudomonas psychrotolerans]
MRLWFWPLTLLGFLAGWAVASIPGALLVWRCSPMRRSASWG